MRGAGTSGQVVWTSGAATWVESVSKNGFLIEVWVPFIASLAMGSPAVSFGVKNLIFASLGWLPALSSAVCSSADLPSTVAFDSSTTCRSLIACRKAQTLVERTLEITRRELIELSARVSVLGTLGRTASAMGDPLPSWNEA